MRQAVEIEAETDWRRPGHSLAAALALAIAIGLGLANGSLASCVGQNLLEQQPASVRAELDAAMAAIPFSEGNIWRATAQDGTQLTVVGTLHLPDSRQEAQIAALQPVLDATTLLVVEADADSEAEMQRRMAENPSLAFIMDGPSLLEQIGPQDWPGLKAAMEARGVPGFMAAKFKPWYAALVLAIPACATADLQARAEGLDKQLMRLAAARGIEIAPLDDVDALFALLTGGTLGSQIADLTLAARIDGLTEDMVTTMEDSYFAGRHRESWEFWRYVDLGLDDVEVARLKEQVAVQEEELLTGRNLAWMPKILALTKGRRAIVAVGAGHLSGEQGILYMLAEAGFTLERLDG